MIIWKQEAPFGHTHRALRLQIRECSYFLYLLCVARYFELLFCFEHALTLLFSLGQAQSSLFSRNVGHASMTWMSTRRSLTSILNSRSEHVADLGSLIVHRIIGLGCSFIASIGVLENKPQDLEVWKAVAVLAIMMAAYSKALKSPDKVYLLALLLHSNGTSHCVFHMAHFTMIQFPHVYKTG